MNYYLDLKALLDKLFEEHGSNPEALFNLYDDLKKALEHCEQLMTKIEHPADKQIDLEHDISVIGELNSQLCRIVAVSDAWEPTEFSDYPDAAHSERGKA